MTRSVRVSEEAYGALRRHRRAGESLSDTILRLACDEGRLSEAIDVDPGLRGKGIAQAVRENRRQLERRDVPKPSSMTPQFRRFLARVTRDLRPERVILFGSRGRGDNRPGSDYDLLIVSGRFRGVPWIERAPLVIRLWDLPLDLEPICLTPEEYRRRRRELSIIGVAAREGVVLPA